MSLRDDLAQLIRLQIGQTELGQQAVPDALTGAKSWGTPQAVIDMLIAYCGGLESAVLRLADEVDDLRLRNGEPEP
jgi:hypothetical protein